MFQIHKSQAEPILDAALFGKIKEVTKQLDKGVNVNYANRDGVTALHNAASGDHAEVITLLLDRGADPNVQ